MKRKIIRLFFFTFIFTFKSAFGDYVGNCDNRCFDHYKDSSNEEVRCFVECIINTLQLNQVPTIGEQLKRVVSSLEGVPIQIEGLRTANEQTRAETTKIKEETIVATKRLGETVASASESVSRLEAEQQRYKQAFEDYKDQTLKEEEAKKIHERREARFYRGLKELFIKGDLEEDKGMDECFKRACELSSDFCVSYSELKKFHDNWNKFMEESNRFAKLFWGLLANNVELQNIIDRPVQLAVSDGLSGDLLIVGVNSHKEL